MSLVIASSLLFMITGAIIVILVNHHMRQQAVIEAEEKIRIMLDRNLATQTYFSHKLRPTLLKITAPTRSVDYFEPVWMSSSHAVREIDRYSKALNPACNYDYKEWAFNANRPETEANPYEKEFLNELSKNHALERRSEIRIIDGKPYFVTLRRGEVMETSCLPCHRSPDKAPEGLAAFYDRERGLHGKIGDVVSAISIRVPLAAAYATANRFSWKLSALLLIVLTFICGIQIWLKKRFLDAPLDTIRENALQVSMSSKHLGQETTLPSARERNELIRAFNRISITLRGHRDRLEARFKEFTAALANRNERPKVETEERKQREKALRKNGESFSRLSGAAEEGIAIQDKGVVVNAEDALRESEEKYRKLYDESRRAEEIYRSLLHTSADAIVIYDTEGKARYINPSFTKIFGWTMEEVKGKRIPFVPESEQEATSAGFKHIMEEGRAIQDLETKRQTKEGRILDVNISGSRYNDHEGRPAGMLVTFREISDRKKLQRQLQQAHKMEAMGTLAGGIAHNFNNLLMTIQGNTSLMLLEIDSSHPHYEGLKNIEQSILGGSAVAKELLGFARGGEYELKATNLNDLINISIQLFGRAKKEIKIHKKYQRDAWTVELDQGQIQQALLNLYINAGQAMMGGGDLYIQTENVTLDEDFVKPYQVEAGRYAKVSVADTGVGMDEATQQRIFEPFFTSKEMGGGTGLGLASVYGIVKNHNGIITVSSEMGEGTSFHIYLPASGKKVDETKKPLEHLVKGKETILFVDDEDDILDIGAKLLKKLGYNTVIAKSGKEALELYEANKDGIDLVILDMVMPHMGGGETYEGLNTISPEVKVLLSSGYSIDGEAMQIMQRGCDAFIQKPFRVMELAEKIRKLLDRE
jgi:PAS domain S-box-containing protein